MKISLKLLSNFWGPLLSSRSVVPIGWAALCATGGTSPTSSTIVEMKSRITTTFDGAERRREHRDRSPPLTLTLPDNDKARNIVVRPPSLAHYDPFNTDTDPETEPNDDNTP